MAAAVPDEEQSPDDEEDGAEAAANDGTKRSRGGALSSVDAGLVDWG